MDKQIIFWLWLQCCLGVDNPRIHRIFNIFDNAQQIYLAEEDELKTDGCFTKKEIEKLTNKNLDAAKKIYNNSVTFGYDIFSFKDKNYPEFLKNIPTPPVVIYVKGKLPDKNKLHIAIVGTRNPLANSKNITFSFAYNLAKQGSVIVSGGAMGIDMQAHMGAVQAGGETICVLGCGINYNYLPANKELRDNIAKQGAIISEYPPNYPPTRYTFPKRNRIISGMSNCTVVMEAGKTSGALITAKYAVSQMKTVFAVKNDNIDNEGANLLIQEGAKSITEYTEILTWYKNLKNNSEKNQISEKSLNNIINNNKKEKKAKSKTKKENKSNVKDECSNKNDNKIVKNKNNILMEQLTERAISVYDTISDIPIHVDDIKVKTGLKINEIVIALTELEINELIISQQGRRYIRK